MENKIPNKCNQITHLIQFDELIHGKFSLNDMLQRGNITN